MKQGFFFRCSRVAFLYSVGLCLRVVFFFIVVCCVCTYLREERNPLSPFSLISLSPYFTLLFFPINLQEESSDDRRINKEEEEVRKDYVEGQGKESKKRSK